MTTRHYSKLEVVVMVVAVVVVVVACVQNVTTAGNAVVVGVDERTEDADDERRVGQSSNLNRRSHLLLKRRLNSLTT
jgi:hypothetical protein